MNREKEMWRVFIAVPLPDFLKQRMGHWCTEYGRRVKFRKWVHPSDLHITVQFLGDTPAEGMSKLSEELRKDLKGIGTFQLEAGGMGTFGRTGQPSILWAGVQGEVERLHELHKQVTRTTARCGFVPEERAYKPHITLGRNYLENPLLKRKLWILIIFLENGIQKIVSSIGLGWVKVRCMRL